MSKQVLVPVANGSEDIETITIVDVLVRAGAQVNLSSCSNRPQITLSRGVTILADSMISDIQFTSFDMIALPGGMPGAESLRDNPILIDGLKTHRAHDKWIAAICASPAVVLSYHSLLGDQATCFPAFKPELSRNSNYSELPVVVDHASRIITSQGPGTAMQFALTLVEILFDTTMRNSVAKALLYSS